jgi:hypothetical protein
MPMKLNIFPPAIINDNWKGDSNRANIDGLAKGFYVRIKPNQPESLLQHELEHVKQFWLFVVLGVVGMAILVSQGIITQGPIILLSFAPAIILPRIYKVKRWMETRAYLVSMKYGRSIDSAARGMMASLDAKITFIEAKRLLETHKK